MIDGHKLTMRVYGPVPSRRLGLSLGVDVVPFKKCSYDCVYCQLGRTEKTTIERNAYVRADDILPEVEALLTRRGARPDYITLGGSGEPTLNTEIEAMVGALKKNTGLPVAVLTNASMLSDPYVRESLMGADVVLPSLDAHNADGFARINRPHPKIIFESMVEGLDRFCADYKGRLWLEVFLVKGINASNADAYGFKQWIDRLAPEKIHLNTAIRPPAEPEIMQPNAETLFFFMNTLGPKCELAVPLSVEEPKSAGKMVDEADLIGILSKRPCTLKDISTGLGIQIQVVKALLMPLLVSRKVVVSSVEGQEYYQTHGSSCHLVTRL